MKKWEVLSKSSVSDSGEILKILLKNRGISGNEIEDFLTPDLSKVTPKSVGINLAELKRAVLRVKKAIKENEQIIVFGDYDVDGITGSAILWETLSVLGARVLPYIPHRVDEGYGLSVKGIENILVKTPDVKLIITVDNGIVAKDAVFFAKTRGIDVIITDHHVASDKLPEAFAIVHTTKLCGAGVGYMLASEFKKNEDLLELVALASIADLVPLTGKSRTLTYFGLRKIKDTKRLGLIELIRESGLDKNSIGPYEVGHIIAPRLNAMGRLESAMDSLRLLCTKNTDRARELSRKLSLTNSQRQNLTQEAVLEAIAQVKIQKTELSRLLFVAHENYQQGVIGLVAGRLVEQYYLPAIVIAKGDVYSKASARSISGFNIIEFIRTASEHLVDAGGHPMAAGFTIETAKIELVQKKLEELALKQVTKKLLTKSLKIDCEIPAKILGADLYSEISKLEPVGMGNPAPVFLTKNLEINDIRSVGQDGKHLKFKFKIEDSLIDAIGFGMGERVSELKLGTKIKAAYTLTQENWNGKNRLQLKLKDFKN